MEQREPRKRIPISKHMQQVIVDPLEFKKNKSSDKARNITSINERISIELWFDKHYIDRNQHGDEDGKRNGIDNTMVEALVLQSVKHLLFYSACVKNFTFLNHTEIGNTGRVNRIVCQRVTDDGMLNVAIEAHYKSLKEYEITVKTAMCTDDFKLGDNQYVVEISGDDSSILKCMINRKVTEICSI